MQLLGQGRAVGRRLAPHSVELLFSLFVGFWVVYVLWITRHFYFWSDDLVIIQHSGSLKGIIGPYNGAPTVPTLVVDRVSVEIAGLSYVPFIVTGALALVGAPVAYFFTARRQLRPPLAAVFALILLWYSGTNLRQAGLNHYCALVGGILCAAALNRGRRADIVIFGGLMVGLTSGGAGLVVAGAVLVHNALTRAPWRRWIAALVPIALFGVWLIHYGPLASAPGGLSLSDKVVVVRDFFGSPFYQAAFGVWPLAALLVVAFFVWGLLQLRQGLVAGANFVAWTLAMVAWPIGLMHSRGAGADAGTFRYAYVSLGFALLAVVPRRRIRRPEWPAADRTQWIAIGTVVVLLFGGARVLYARSSLQHNADGYSDFGWTAKGTMLVLRLGPSVIPDSTPLRFFGFYNPHGTAGQTRALMAQYGTSLVATRQTVDRQLVAWHVAKVDLGLPAPNFRCRAVTGPQRLAPTSIGESLIGITPPGSVATTDPLRYRVFARDAVVIDVRRFGEDWVRLASVPAGHFAYLTLPALSTPEPWTIRADGLCLVP